MTQIAERRIVSIMNEMEELRKSLEHGDKLKRKAEMDLQEVSTRLLVLKKRNVF